MASKRVEIAYGFERTGHDSADVLRFMYGNNPGRQWTPAVADAQHTMHKQTFSTSNFRHDDTAAVDQVCDGCGRLCTPRRQCQCRRKKKKGA